MLNTGNFFIGTYDVCMYTHLNINFQRFCIPDTNRPKVHVRLPLSWSSDSILWMLRSIQRKTKAALGHHVLNLAALLHHLGNWANFRCTGPILADSTRGIWAGHRAFLVLAALSDWREHPWPNPLSFQGRNWSFSQSPENYTKTQIPLIPKWQI